MDSKGWGFIEHMCDRVTAMDFDSSGVMTGECRMWKHSYKLFLHSLASGGGGALLQRTARDKQLTLLVV